MKLIWLNDHKQQGRLRLTIGFKENPTVDGGIKKTPYNVNLSFRGAPYDVSKDNPDLLRQLRTPEDFDRVVAALKIDPRRGKEFQYYDEIKQKIQVGNVDPREIDPVLAQMTPLRHGLIKEAKSLGIMGYEKMTDDELSAVIAHRIEFLKKKLASPNPPPVVNKPEAKTVGEQLAEPVTSEPEKPKVGKKRGPKSKAEKSA